MATGGISGLAVSITAGGFLLIYSGIKNVPIVSGLREISAGKIPTGIAPKVSSANAAEHALTLPAPSGGAGSANAAEAGAGGFIAPVSGRITDTFGSRGGTHKGTDIAVPSGTPVKATRGGTVVIAQNGYGAAGNYVKIDHGAGWASEYMHLSRIMVSIRQTVAQGQVIALSGSTGRSTGPHLHFGLFRNGTRVNPQSWVAL